MSKYKTLMDRLDILRSRYFQAISAFYAYEGLCEVTAPNIVGKSKAEENSKVMGDFKNLFVPAKEALRVFFFIELAKLFDVSNQALHINKVINFTERNLEHLTVETFEEYNNSEPRQFLKELVEGYKGVSSDDLKEVRLMLEEHKDTIGKLKKYRDKWLAHDDVDKENHSVSISGEEIKALFDVLAKVLNLLTSRLNSSTSMWDHIEPNAKHHTRMVVEYLGRYEPYRLKEIEEECKRKIKEFSKD